MALFNQFKTAFNWFFLIYNIIASIPQISDLDPAAEVTPFVVVLILNLIKEAIEDYLNMWMIKKQMAQNFDF